MNNRFFYYILFLAVNVSIIYSMEDHQAQYKLNRPQGFEFLSKEDQEYIKSLEDTHYQQYTELMQLKKQALELKANIEKKITELQNTDNKPKDNN